MAELQFALIGEGNTDQALLPIIQWLLRQHLAEIAILGTWVNRGVTPVPQPRTLAERIASTISGLPCHVLFVHRDADIAGRAARVEEIDRAVSRAQIALGMRVPVISVVPVRETEAWLCFDEAAIRAGVGNPHGRISLTLPRLNRVESIADPKRLLRDLLRTASELRGRHLDRLIVDPVSVSININDFSPLRQLPAFQAFEEEVRDVSEIRAGRSTWDKFPTIVSPSRRRSRISTIGS